MIEVLLFMLLETVLAFAVQKYAKYEPYNGIKPCGWLLEKNSQAIIVYCILLVLGILFSGLRTTCNDTATYIRNYVLKIYPFPQVLSEMDWSIGANPGFTIFQGILKMIFGANPLWLTFIVAIITSVSFFEFYRRYSQNFGLSIYLVIASAFFVFTMSAMKQVIATSMGIWLLPIAKRRRWILFGTLLGIAFTIHPYVILFAVIPVFIGEAASWKTKVCLVLALIIGANLISFLEGALKVTAEIGDDYSLELWGENTGVSVFRLLFFIVMPTLGIIYKEEIKKSKDLIFSSCVNLSYISASFMILASFGGANMFGRMANYWEPFTYIALPGICMTLKNKPIYKILMPCIVVCYFIFYIRFYAKYGYDWTGCYYRHAGLFDLFR